MPKKHDPRERERERERERKDGMPKKYDKKYISIITIIKERESQSGKESIFYFHHMYLLDQLVNISVISMDPIFDLQQM